METDALIKKLKMLSNEIEDKEKFSVYNNMLSNIFADAANKLEEQQNLINKENIRPERLQVGDIVRHFKAETVEPGSSEFLYVIVGFGYFTESKPMEKCVIYRALYANPKNNLDHNIFIRPYDMFMGKVDRAKYPDIKQEYRFEFVASTTTRSHI